MCFRLNLVGCVANSDTQWCTGGAVTTRLFPTALHDEYASSSYSVVDYCMQVTNLSSAADRPSFNYHGSVYCIEIPQFPIPVPAYFHLFISVERSRIIPVALKVNFAYKRFGNKF